MNEDHLELLQLSKVLVDVFACIARKRVDSAKLSSNLFGISSHLLFQLAIYSDIR